MKGLTQRIITAIIFVLIIGAGIFGGVKTFISLIFLIAMLCSYELLGILLPRDETKMIKKIFGVVIAMTPLFYMFGYNLDWPIMLWSPMGLLGSAGSIIFIFELFSRSSNPFAASGSLVIALVYIGVPMALLIDLAQTPPYDPFLLLSIFLFTWINDSGAYFAGTFFGKHKLFERISPNKTVEGSIGGLILAVVAGIFFAQWCDSITQEQFMILAVIVSVMATLGDLVESMLKRSKGIKDTGKWLPGHGGFLDRFDGFIFAIPFVYLYLTALQ